MTNIYCYLFVFIVNLSTFFKEFEELSSFCVIWNIAFITIHIDNIAAKKNILTVNEINWIYGMENNMYVEATLDYHTVIVHTEF